MNSFERHSGRRWRKPTPGGLCYERRRFQADVLHFVLTLASLILGYVYGCIQRSMPAGDSSTARDA